MKAGFINRFLCVFLAGVLTAGSISMPVMANEAVIAIEDIEQDSIVSFDADENIISIENNEADENINTVEDNEKEVSDEITADIQLSEEESNLENDSTGEESVDEEISLEETEEQISEIALGAAHDYSINRVFTASEINAITETGNNESKGLNVGIIAASGDVPKHLSVSFCDGTVSVKDGKVQLLQGNNEGAKIVDGYFDVYPFSNVVGEICGGTYMGGIYQKSINATTPGEWNQIVIEAGKTIKIGGVGLVVTNGNVINKGTMDLSEVDLGNCISKTGIFRHPTFISKHLFQNDGLIILPATVDESFIKGLKITGTGKIRIGSEEYANDYDAAAEAMLAFKSGLPYISSERSNQRTYLNQPIADTDLSQFVKGGTKPYSFVKVSGPEWITISLDGIISGIPTETGLMNDCVIKVTDKVGAEISGTIRVRPCYKEVREQIDLIEIGSNINSIAYKDSAISIEGIVFDNATSIKLNINAEGAKWQKKTGTNTYTDVTSGKFEAGATYRLMGVGINNNASDVFGFEFDIDNLKVYMDGKLCEITSSRRSVAPQLYSSVRIKTPDIVIGTKKFAGEGTSENPWTGLGKSDASPVSAYIKDGVLNIIGSGALKECSAPEDCPWYTYKDYIKGIVFTHVTNIPDYAFKGFTKIEEIKLTNYIATVGQYAFEDCTALKKVSFQNPGTSLADGCFKGCKALSDITIPAQITKIGRFIFEDCKSLKDVTLSEKLKAIPNRAFAGCTSLEEITIPKTVDNIGNQAFLGCNKLGSIDLHQDVARTTGKIGANAFENCTSLKNVNLGQYKTITEYAFKSCPSLEAITFPETTEFIDNDVFQYCTKLKTVVFEGVLEPGVAIKSAFSGLGTKNGTNNPKVYLPLTYTYTVPESSTLWCGGYLDGEIAPAGDLQGITITTAPTKIAYKKGEMFDPTGMVVTAKYSDNTVVDVTSRCVFTPNAPLDVLNNNITVSFTSKGVTKSAQLSVYVIELQSIEVVTPPNKIKYLEGELFDSTGVEVVAHYTANVDENVTNRCTFSPMTALQKADDKITVTFTELADTKTAEIPIRVLSDELLEIKVEHVPDKILYKAGELFDVTGLKVEAYFADETDADVTGGCTYTPSTPLTVNDTKVTASYTKGLITKSVDIAIEVATDFDIDIADYNDTYTGKIIKPAVSVRDNNLKTMLTAKDYKLFYNNNLMPNDGPQIDSRVARFVTDETFTFNKAGIESFLAGKTPSELGSFNPALPYVVIQGIKNYSGATFINYNIKTVTVFSGNNLVAGTQLVIPEGFEVGKSVSVIKKFVANKKTLAFGKDYTFEIWQGGNLIVSAISGKAPAFKPETAGVYTLKIKCINGYAGDYDTNLDVAAKTELLSTAKVVIGANVKKVNYDASDNANFVKNGNKIELANPSVVFADASTKDKNKIMITVAGHYLTTADFDVSYTNNAAVGIATVKLTPKIRTPYEISNGAIQYAGTKTFTFSITGKALNAKKFTINGITSLPATTYDSKPWTLERLLGNSYVVENDGVVLTNGTNYKVSYLNNVKKGTATVVFEGISAGGYTGTIKKSVKINPMAIDVSMLTVAPESWPSVAFTKMGGTLDSSIRMKLQNGYRLNAGSDYTIKYVNNKKWGADSYLVISGKGNFSGNTGQIRFNTIKKNLANGYNDGVNYFGDRTISVKVDPIAFVNNAPTRKYSPKVYVYDGTAAIAQKKEFEITPVNFDTSTIQTYMNDRVANYALRPQVKISAVDSTTCGYAGELIVDVPIKEKQITVFSAKDTKLTINLGDVRYNGNVVYVPVTVKYDNVLLVEGRDYTLQYGRSITGKGTVTVYGKGEYYGSVKKTFVIKGKNIK